MGLEDRIRLPNLNLIHRRSRLLNLLDKFIKKGQRLITIYAPGGYGKSILWPISLKQRTSPSAGALWSRRIGIPPLFLLCWPTASPIVSMK